jgi:hypothetical protein
MSRVTGLVGGWFTPMFDDQVDTRLVNAIALAILVAGYAIGMLLLRRILDPGPLARGEARWRYRNRALRERIARAWVWLGVPDRSPGWWATRIEFSVAIAALALVALLLPSYARPTFGGDGLSARGMLVMAAGVAGMIVGLAWMVRIYRAPLRMDSKAYWRYRDGA